MSFKKNGMSPVIGPAMDLEQLKKKAKQEPKKETPKTQPNAQPKKNDQ
jgi:hypothetical protein